MEEMIVGFFVLWVGFLFVFKSFLKIILIFFNCLFFPEGKTHFHNHTFCITIYYTVWLFYRFWGSEALLLKSRTTENDKTDSKSIYFMHMSMIFFFFSVLHSNSILKGLNYKKNWILR